MKMYEFTISLIGTGDTPEEAWEEVCEYLNFNRADKYDMPETPVLIDEWED